MDFKRLGIILIIGGVALIAAAFAWWLTFYSSILQELSRAPGAPASGTSVFDLVSCFYSSRDVCGFISGFARLLGRTPYEPWYCGWVWARSSPASRCAWRRSRLSGAS